MSNINALLKGRAIKLSDGCCTERAYQKELAIEEYLRILTTRLPKLTSRRRAAKKFIAAVNACEAGFRILTDDQLREELRCACHQMRKLGLQNKLLARGFAAVREASRRTLGMRHHDVQLMGGWALLQGTIAEMETGEGKTLVATLAACTAAATGATVHIITVNDYLASRDAESNLPLYRFFGLTVGTVVQDLALEKRYSQYACNIVYVSNKEVVFDYLKDRIAVGSSNSAHYQLRHLYRESGQPKILLEGLHVAIVDEADSILIDEARTPLIISETVADENAEALYTTGLELARRLDKGVHFGITEHREVWLTVAGENYLKAISRNMTGVWTASVWRNDLVQKALSAIWCYHRDQHYIKNDGKIDIVDEFSGRVMPDRSWENGLHQMIEAKEGCEITGRRKTLSRMTYQRFLSRYLLLSGMTGTATEVNTELKRVYNLEVFKIPTHLPVVRKKFPSRCWAKSDQRWRAVAIRSQRLSESGVAVLIGTRSVEASEKLSRFLSLLKVEHAVLNARNDKEEAAIISEAGHSGRVTIATNMAGRGTDIKPADEVIAKGGLHVILTEYHESARIDRQLIGRAARQGQPGSYEAMVSLEDELFRYGPGFLSVVNKITFNQKEKSRLLTSVLVKWSQYNAERHNARIRIATLKQDKKLYSLLAFSGVPS